MNIPRKTRPFFRDDDGAVCVDPHRHHGSGHGGPVPLEASSTRVGHVAAQASPSNPTFP